MHVATLLFVHQNPQRESHAKATSITVAHKTGQHAGLAETFMCTMHDGSPSTARSQKRPGDKKQTLALRNLASSLHQVEKCVGMARQDTLATSDFMSSGLRMS